MKVSLKSTLNNKTENITTIDNTTAIKINNKITYMINKDKHQLRIISPQKLILEKNNEELEFIMVFENNKKTSCQYITKPEEYKIEIDIKTTKLEIKDNIILIQYTVIDSEELYEYKIEMSEKK